MTQRMKPHVGYRIPKLGNALIDLVERDTLRCRVGGTMHPWGELLALGVTACPLPEGMFFARSKTRELLITVGEHDALVRDGAKSIHAGQARPS